MALFGINPYMGRRRSVYGLPEQYLAGELEAIGREDVKINVSEFDNLVYCHFLESSISLAIDHDIIMRAGSDRETSSDTHGLVKSVAKELCRRRDEYLMSAGREHAKKMSGRPVENVAVHDPVPVHKWDPSHATDALSYSVMSKAEALAKKYGVEKTSRTEVNKFVPPQYGHMLKDRHPFGNKSDVRDPVEDASAKIKTVTQELQEKVNEWLGGVNGFKPIRGGAA